MNDFIEIKKEIEEINKAIRELGINIKNIRLNQDDEIDIIDANNSFDKVSDLFDNINIDVNNLLDNFESNKFNIYQKIQQARVELQNRELKKTGYNKFANYKYFELGDFLPHINDVCLKIGLYTEFKFTPQQAWLYIRDIDNPDIFREWSTPVEIATLKGCSAIQNIGGTQSFSRRYLYMMAFEIAETDVIDGGAVDADAEAGKQKINRASVMTINNLIDETGVDKIKFLSWAGVNKVEDIPNSALNICIQMLNKKKKDIETKKQQEESQEEVEKHTEEDFEF
ncbi:ERF family protein [Clostridium sardiniense]|uniref:ERF family protein n=1 Tax=Clostridium sardiniense TaxID=29369 RepID=UPI003D336AFD